MCKFKICKKFAKILHRRIFFFLHFSIFFNYFAIFLQLVCNFFAIFLQIFFTFISKKKRTRGHESIIKQPLLENSKPEEYWPKNGYLLSQSQINLQKSWKKKLQKSCKNFAKSCCKKICKIFADFLQNFCNCTFCKKFCTLDHVKSL